MTSSRKDLLSGRARQILLVGVFCVAALFTLQRAWNTNAASLQTRAHLSRDMECKANLGLMWEPADVAPSEEQTPYLQALSAAAGAPGAILPGEQWWSRDHRLLYWFRAHALIRQGKYAESLPYLKQAQAGTVLSASGHFILLRHEDACGMFTWLMANEVSDGATGHDVASWATSLLDGDHAPVVVQAYTQALTYQPAQVEWRLMLARALLVLDRLQEAQTTLEPVLRLAAPEQQAMARKLIDDYLIQHSPRP